MTQSISHEYHVLDIAATWRIWPQDLVGSTTQRFKHRPVPYQGEVEEGYNFLGVLLVHNQCVPRYIFQTWAHRCGLCSRSATSGEA